MKSYVLLGKRPKAPPPGMEAQRGLFDPLEQPEEEG
jgi:hypothetical protein